MLTDAAPPPAHPREIWRGEKAQKFRAKLAKEPLPICNRCCGSYVYGKFERPATRRET